MDCDMTIIDLIQFLAQSKQYRFLLFEELAYGKINQWLVDWSTAEGHEIPINLADQTLNDLIENKILVYAGSNDLSNRTWLELNQEAARQVLMQGLVNVLSSYRRLKG